MVKKIAGITEIWSPPPLPLKYSARKNKYKGSNKTVETYSNLFAWIQHIIKYTEYQTLINLLYFYLMTYLILFKIHIYIAINHSNEKMPHQHFFKHIY